MLPSSGDLRTIETEQHRRRAIELRRSRTKRNIVRRLSTTQEDVAE